MSETMKVDLQNPAFAVDHAIALASAVLAPSGWKITSLEVDLTTRKIVMVVKRADGRWLHVYLTQRGRSSVERWHGYEAGTA